MYKKEDVIKIDGPGLSHERNVITDNDCICEDELDSYMHKEMEYLYEKINLLRLFKLGNIGFRDVFFKYTFSVMGLINYNVNKCSHNQTRNTISNIIFSLSDLEVDRCNEWLNDYSGYAYKLLKNSIDEFSWGLEQIDIPTGFEQYTTALEMTLLPKNKSGKKQMLANRVCAYLGKTEIEYRQLHQKILDCYRFRSESLHEGDGSNITKKELHELEDITRQVLKKNSCEM